MRSAFSVMVLREGLPLLDSGLDAIFSLTRLVGLCSLMEGAVAGFFIRGDDSFTTGSGRPKSSAICVNCLDMR